MDVPVIPNPIDWIGDAIGDMTDGSALVGKACGMAYGTAQGLYKGVIAFVEGLL